MEEYNEIPVNSPTNKRKSLVIALLAALILVVGIGGTIFYYNKPEQKASRIQEKFFSTTPQNVDFFTTAKNMANFLENSSSFISPETEGEIKVLLGNSLSETDRQRGTELLKEVARNPKYSNAVRVRALTYIADHYGLDFTDQNFAKEVTFIGDSFGNLLSESGGDVGLAMRKLNEWSNTLLPNLTATYRIALWYAEEVYKNKSLSLEEKAVLLKQMDTYLAEGDKIFEKVKDTHAPVRIAMAYALKARAVYLSGGDTSEADNLFQLAMKEYRRQPFTIFQLIYLTSDSMYYAAFLARQSGQTQGPNVTNLLQPVYTYLAAPQVPEKRNVRFVSFLTAARDSKTADYPAPDFNGTDIENIGKAYPEFGQLVDKLDLREYVKGHPAEVYTRQN